MKEEKILEKLSTSKFRSSFYLKQKDFEYIDRVGLEKIKEHAYDFITKRLSGAIVPYDGRQTPMKGHPVFITQHKTATCCRNCLYKWHKIKPNKELSKEEIDYIVNLIMYSIEKEYKKYKNNS